MDAQARERSREKYHIGEKQGHITKFKRDVADVRQQTRKDRRGKVGSFNPKLEPYCPLG